MASSAKRAPRPGVYMYGPVSNAHPSRCWIEATHQLWTYVVHWEQWNGEEWALERADAISLPEAMRLFQVHRTHGWRGGEQGLLTRRSEDDRED